MSTDKLKITFKCKKCGGTALELPDDHTDDSIAKCQSCQTEIGSWGDIKAKAREEAVHYVRGMFRDAFKGKKGWTFK